MLTSTLLLLLLTASFARARAGEPSDTALAVTDSIAADSIAADTLCIAQPTEAEEMKRPHDDLYQHPYSMWRSCPNWKRLWENTAVLFGAGFATLGVLELLPDNTTAWNTTERKKVPFFKRWYNHVHRGPVWDSDMVVFNYILHPYAGAAYYMSARSQGLNVLGSMAYAAFISTVFWEYGIEAFNEVPSIQDLVITPIFGMVVGEAFYIAKRRIVENDYRLAGSPVLGNIVAVIIDPVNEVLGFIFGNSARQWNKYNRAARATRVCSSWGMVGNGFGLNVNVTF